MTIFCTPVCRCVSLADSVQDMVVELSQHGIIRKVPAPGRAGVLSIWKRRVTSAVVDWPLQKLAIVCVLVPVAAYLLAPFLRG